MPACMDLTGPCCLQAEFYSWALTGAGLNETVLGRAPTADGGQLVGQGAMKDMFGCVCAFCKGCCGDTAQVY